MESCLLRRWAPAVPRCPSSLFLALRLLGLLSVSWVVPPAGGQSVTHTGLPIMASLANRAISFSCRINYQNIPEFKFFTASYYHVDLQGQKSSEKPISCQHSPGAPNQTVDCTVKLWLPDASATGTYYCCIQWQSSTIQGHGTFILVRDTGYQQPPPSSQKALYFGFTGLLSVLSVLVTALLLWKKKQMLVPGKHRTRMGPDPKSASGPTKPPSEPVYTALQHRETEVYDQIETTAGSQLSSQDLPPKKPHRFEDDNEFNMVYENL
uniref:NFAT activation molecule 1 isoform X2 n=1 Tax=Jaculus jaculus TaxID=51337 RepID=UPI001E1B382E|nr:NFAT activation molecule 1 isoform X2 [Jaculus jaculus]